MLKGKHNALHPLLKLAEWILIMVVSVSAMFGVWMLLPINHADTGTLLLMQAMQAIGLFIVPALVVAYLWSEEPLQWLGLAVESGKWKAESEKRNVECGRLDVRLALLSVGIMVTAIPLINCLVAWNESIRLPESMRGIEQLMQHMEQQAEQVLQGFRTYRNGAWWVLVVNLIVLAVLPGVGEEMAFRGVLQQLMQRSNGSQSKQIAQIEINSSQSKHIQQIDVRQHVAVWVTAFVFSFVHFQFYGFIPRLLMGALLGYAFAWSGRLGYSMIMHVTNNALSVIVFYLGTYIWHLPQAEIDAIGTQHTWWLTLVCTPVMAVLLFLFYKRSAVSYQ